MGIEWLNKGKSGMKKRSTNKEGEQVGAQGCMGAVFHLFKFHFYPFPFHHPHHQSSSHPSSTTTTNNVAFFHDHEPNHVLKGVEAPRNSLEEKPLKEVASSSSSSSTQITYGYIHKQIMSMKIKTTSSPNSSSCLNSKPKNDRESSPSLSEYSDSPSIKTPNLVARLMGLDLLPPTTSPKLDEMILKNPSCKNRILSIPFDKNVVSGTVSLPETPRISASGKSDVENRRLSLQLEDIPAFTIKTEKPDRCNKQILKQVKEKVGRTFGIDVTNTIRRGSDSNLVNNISSIMKYESDAFSNQILNLPLRKEPQLELSVTDSLSNKDKKHNESTVKVQVHLNQNQKKPLGCGGRVRTPPQACDDGVRSKKEDPVTTNKGIIVSEKKVKKTSLSSDLINMHRHANPQPSNQGPNHSSFTIKQTKQNLLSYNSPSSSTNLYNNHKTLGPTCHKFQENRQLHHPHCTSSNFIHNSEQLNHYIQWILRRTGIEKEDGQVSLNKGYPINHPLDPSLFHYLELFHFATTTRTVNRLGSGGKVHGAICTTRVKTRGTYCSACSLTGYGDTTRMNHVTVCATCFAPNRKMYGRDCATCVVCTCSIDSRRQRKLVFDLVDEHLADILVNPFMNLRRKPWIVHGHEEKIRGVDLVEMISERIKGSLRSVKCEVREDIDAMIYDDLRRAKIGNKWQGFEEEQEYMIMYIEDCIVRELVHETTMLLNNV